MILLGLISKQRKDQGLVELLGTIYVCCHYGLFSFEVYPPIEGLKKAKPSDKILE